ncbi:MAG: hypothetical protein ACREXU_08665 [Gammaproteobacteria bacterium]
MDIQSRLALPQRLYRIFGRFTPDRLIRRKPTEEGRNEEDRPDG